MGLGRLTSPKMIGGFTTVGPNAPLSLARETYAGNTPRIGDMAEMLRFPGFWRMAAKNMRSGAYEFAGAISTRVYVERCRKYCPELTVADLEPYPTGIRAQAVRRDGGLADDFLFDATPRSLHVCNAPSPAATSAFPIGDEIARRVVEQRAATDGERVSSAA